MSGAILPASLGSKSENGGVSRGRAEREGEGREETKGEPYWKGGIRGLLEGRCGLGRPGGVAKRASVGACPFETVMPGCYMVLAAIEEDPHLRVNVYDDIVAAVRHVGRVDRAARCGRRRSFWVFCEAGAWVVDDAAEGELAT